MDRLFLLRPCHGFVTSWRSLTAEVCVECQASVCEVCGAQSGTRTDLSPSTSSFLFPCYSLRAPYSFLSYCDSYKKKMGEAWKQISGGTGRKSTLSSFENNPTGQLDRSFSWFSMCAPCFSCGSPSII